jgi:hypothetical protein
MQVKPGSAEKCRTSQKKAQTRAASQKKGAQGMAGGT